MDVDVFICHRGPDTKDNFVSDMVKHELQGRSLYADKWGLQPGEPNWPTLLSNLRSARIVLVVLSPRFQESAWCLEELCAATEQGRLDEKTLRVVWFGKGTAKVDEDQMALALVELKGAAQLQDIASLGDAAILQRWRSALQKAAETVAWPFDEGGSHQDLEKAVAKDIEHALPALIRARSSMKVGIPRIVDQLLALPEMLQESGVCRLGLLGMGGIGKTTLAEALHDCLRRDFVGNSVCFVADIRSRPGFMEEIQQEILSKLWKSDAKRPHDKKEGRNSISDKLRSQKVLLVLDGVEEGHAKWLMPKECGSGSIIIITSRSQQALEDAGCTLHRVDLLPEPQARELFLQHVYSIPSDADASPLLSEMLKLCNGLPLSLKVMGSRLKGKPTSIWEETLRKLQAAGILRADGDNLFEQLKVSYDGLDSDEEREMFLDAACLFLGGTAGVAKEIWKRRGWCAASGLQMLVDRCLVVVDPHYDYLQMHNHLRDLGRSIEKMQRPRQRFRETADLQKKCPTQIDISWAARAYIEQEDPRVAICTRELTQLIPWSGSLEVLDLSDSRHLTALPAMTIGNLRHMLLYGCERLLGLPQSISCLNSLQTLDLAVCKSLAALPEGISRLSSLQKLDLSRCYSLAALPKGISRLSSLQTLDLSWCGSLAALPKGISRLSSLRTLSIPWCNSLAALPEGISGLSSLRTLDIQWCSSLAALPEGISGLRSLQTLELGGCCSLATLPEGIRRLSSLQKLDLRWCTSLRALPEGISRLSSLQTLDLRGCGSLAALPEGINRLSSLRTLKSERSDSLHPM